MNSDCWLEVLSKLSPKERRSVKLVNRSFNGLIDFVDKNEPNLRIVHYSYRNGHWPGNASTTLNWSAGSFGFTDFKRILTQYPRLQCLEVTGMNHLADHHLYSILEHCPCLKSLEFYSCPYLSEYFHSDFGFHQATQIGWGRLLTGFQYQITRLVLEDCDLDNEHFKLIVGCCKVLEHLNVSNNSQINDYSPLRTDISPHIRVLKVGPKLGVARQQIRSLFFTHSLINEIVDSERCLGLLHLQIHCLLTPRLVTLSKLQCLQRLTIKFACLDDIADGVSSHETDILSNLLLLSTRLRLKHLHFYQINYKVTSDQSWLREQLVNFYENTRIERNIGQLSSTSLKTFTFYSNRIETIHKKAILFENILKQSFLEEFHLATEKNNDDDIVHCSEYSNRFNDFLLDCLEDCKQLTHLRLENVLPNKTFKQILSILAHCIKTGRLKTFAMSCEQQASFLEYLNTNSIFRNLSDLNRPLSRLVFIGRSINRQPSKQTTKEMHKWFPDSGQTLQHSHERIVKREQITQNEWNLRFIINKNDDAQANGGQWSLATGSNSDSLLSNDNDLSDLCQLLDSSFGLIDHVVDLITLCTNYIVIVLTCALMLKPIRLASSTSAVIHNFVQTRLLRRSASK